MCQWTSYYKSIVHHCPHYVGSLAGRARARVLDAPWRSRNVWARTRSIPCRVVLSNSVYAVLSGLNAAIVGLIALAVMTHIILIPAAFAGPPSGISRPDNPRRAARDHLGPWCERFNERRCDLTPYPGKGRKPFRRKAQKQRWK